MNSKKTARLVIGLGAFMFAIGIFGFFRTGSPTALYGTGAFALLTAICGVMYARGGRLWHYITTAWITVNTVTLAFLTIKRIGPDAPEGSVYLFGAMTLFSLLIWIWLIRDRVKAVA